MIADAHSNAPSPSSATGFASSSAYLTTGQAARILGCSIPTVKALIAGGSLRSYVSRGGHHRVDSRSVQAYLNGEEECGTDALEEQGKLIAVYVRVSSQSQATAGSLDRQLERLLEEVEKREGVERSEILIFKDVASAFGERKGLNALVDSMIEGKVSKVYCEYADRLSRIAALTRLVEHLAKRANVEIVCLDVEETDTTDTNYFVKELMDYMTAVMNKVSAAKSRKVTVKEISDEVARRVLKLRASGYSLLRIEKIAEKEGLKNERGEVLSYYLISQVCYSPKYAVLGLQVDPRDVAEEWARTGLRKGEDKARLKNKEIYGAYKAECQKRGIKALSATMFGRTMEKVWKGHRIYVQGSVAWKGLTLA